MRNLDGAAITIAPGSQLQVRIPLQAQYQGALLARRLPAEVQGEAATAVVA